MSKLIILFTTLLLVGFSIFTFVITNKDILVKPNGVSDLAEPIKDQPNQEKKDPLSSKQVESESLYSAWIPWWDEKRSLASLKKARNKLNLISPVWYKLDEQGQIIEIKSPSKQQVLDAAASAKLAIIPTIFNDFDSKRVSLFLNSEALKKDETDKLIEIALSKGYQGWDLDWEEISKNDKESFTNYVNYLAQRLHEKNLKLFVTVHAQTGKPTDWEGSKGQDWPGLAKQADFIRIMAYDFHHAESAPGPIAPLDKLREVIDYAVLVIPREKIVFGLPTYGYDWSQEGNQSFQYVDILERIEEFNGNYQRDPESFALKGSYILDGVKHTLWFEDSESITQKISLARSFGINQFCFWNLGGEDEKIWEIN